MKNKRRSRNKRMIKHATRLLTTSIVAAPAIMMMPTLVGAEPYPVPSVETLPIVNQHIGAYVNGYINEELSGVLTIGDSITVDLDQIFESSASLEYTVITYNSSVAEVDLTSGDLHINANQVGSTMVEVIARTSEQGTPVYEQFQLNVASILDIKNDGIGIDDIVSYRHLNSSRITPASLERMLHNIDTIEAPVNSPPITVDAEYHINMYEGDLVTLDMNSFFSDPDGDELFYRFINVSSGSIPPGAELNESMLTINSSTGALITVEASEDDEWHDTVSKEFHITILNSAPVGVADSYTTEEDTDLEGASVLANDTDANGDNLTAVLMDSTIHGNLELNEDDGTFIYEPGEDFYGTDSFSYKVYDGSAYTAPVNVSIQVSPVDDEIIVNEAPILSLRRLNELTFDLSTLFEDPDGPIEEYRIVGDTNESFDAEITDSILKINGLSSGDFFSLSVQAKDSHGTWTEDVSIDIEIDHSSATRSTSLEIGESYTINIIADYLLAGFSYSVESSDVNIATASIEIVDGMEMVNVTGIGLGTAVITIVGDDGAGTTISDKITFQINEASAAPIAPIAIPQLPGNYLTILDVDGTATFVNTQILQFPFSDPDTAELVYTAEVLTDDGTGAGGVTLTTNGTTFNITGVTPGEVTLRITASDGVSSVSADYVLRVLGLDEYVMLAYGTFTMDIDVGFIPDSFESSSSADVSAAYDATEGKVRVTVNKYAYSVNYNESNNGKYYITVSNQEDDESKIITIYLKPYII